MTNHLLPRSTPEAQGVPSTAISAFLQAVEQQKIELHSLVLLRRGHVIAEGWWSPYSAERIHLLYSLSKSFTSTAVGLAIEEGRLSVDDSVCSFFPGKAPGNASEHLRAMRVHHLLSMSTGHVEDALGPSVQRGGDDWLTGFFAAPPEQAPGTIFTYNNIATFVLSAILQKLTGEKLIDYLRPRLLDPLGIEQAYWQENPRGINLGFSGLHITTESIARFGQLYLQQGEWQGQQLVPKQWVETATAKHIATDAEKTGDWAQGYGYQFWQSRHNSYRGDGAFGQFCLILPDQETVLATTAGVDNMQSVLDLVWSHLLPALRDESLPEDVAAQSVLSEQLTNLSIEPTRGEATSPLAVTVSGKRYDFSDSLGDDDFHWLKLHFNEEELVFEGKDDEGEHRLRCGYSEWTPGMTTFRASGDVPVLSSGAWTSPDCFTLEIRYIESPHALTLTFRFEEAHIRVSGRWNVMFGEVEMTEMVGRL